MIEIFSSSDMPSDAKVPEKEFLTEDGIYDILCQEYEKWKVYISDKSDEYPEKLYSYNVEKLYSEIMDYLFKICKSNREHYKCNYTIQQVIVDLRLDRIDRFKRILRMRFRNSDLSFGACSMVSS